MVIICKNWKTIEINAHEKMNTDRYEKANSLREKIILFSCERNFVTKGGIICYNYAFYLGFNKNKFSWCGIHNKFKYILLNFVFTQYY